MVGVWYVNAFEAGRHWLRNVESTNDFHRSVEVVERFVLNFIGNMFAKTTGLHGLVQNDGFACFF